MATSSSEFPRRPMKHKRGSVTAGDTFFKGLEAMGGKRKGSTQANEPLQLGAAKAKSGWAVLSGSLDDAVRSCDSGSDAV